MKTHNTARTEYLLRLSLCQTLNNHQRHLLAKQCHSLGQANRLSTHQLKQLSLSDALITQLNHPSPQLLNTALEWLTEDQHTLIDEQSPHYPERLAQISQAPPLLYVDGQIKCLQQPSIALVGSRNPSPPGKRIAYQLSQQLADLGWLCCSGLAMGIDAAVHRAALDAEQNTIAVLGCGINQQYPRCNHALFQAIANHGALVSEWPWGSPPKRQHFPLRNRIISGLSMGVVIIEATLKSGSLITAKWALEQNREVFATPGPIHSHQHKGCHFLIKQGAKLVESAEDIVVELPPLQREPQTHAAECRKNSIQNNEKALDANNAMLIEYLQTQPASMAQLQINCAMPPSELARRLIELKMARQIEQQNGKYFWISPQ